MTERALTVSIIIPAYNAQKTIASVIQSCLDQDYPPDEVIVVDDGSVDKTSQIAQSFEKIIYIRQENAGPAAARNFGAAAAKGEILFFTDSDCLAHNDWVRQSLVAFKDDSVVAVAGSYGIANSGSLLARCVYKEILFRHERLMPDYPRVFGSYNVAIRKKVFDEVGGFNTMYRYASGEDNDLSYKILASGRRIRFVRRSLVDHFHPDRLFKYLQEQWRHGFWRAKMYREHPQMMWGDDYTFWKDMAEVPLAAALALCLLFLFFVPAMKTVFAGGLLALIFLELFFSFRMTRNISEVLYLGFVTVLRSFARTLGFFSGGFQLINKNNHKKR